MEEEELNNDVMSRTLVLTELLDDVENTLQREAIVLKHLETISANKCSKISDFKSGLEWFNVYHPLSLDKELKGKITVLDFFTYCCINCLHILPDLEALEAEFSVSDGVAVVGVHSAKFDNEKDSANILAAVQRYGITHPVVNDCDAVLWNELNIPCWPTLLVLDPEGHPLFLLVGEGNRELLLLLVRTTLKFFQDKGEVLHHDLPIKLSSHLLPASPLLFPGKVAHHNNRLAIADTGHHRIIIANSNGTVEFVVGGNECGFIDGSFTEAKFHSPQGVCFLNHDTVFVADTENHTIRQIDMKARKVKTVTGTGKQGSDRVGGQKWEEQSISSPWDLTIASDPGTGGKHILLIAMAGMHQIWALFLSNSIWWKGKSHAAGDCVMIAGSGKEENRNNAYPHAAGFAQPSGLCVSEEQLFVADSESSSVRQISLKDGKVQALVGGDGNPTNLFAFGDEDGVHHKAKLQHPLGVAWCAQEKTLFVADSYNHKVKMVYVGTRSCTTFVGNGKPGNGCGLIADGNVQFNEPGGLCTDEGGQKLYVADTNNHSIKVIDLVESSVNELLISTSVTDSVSETPGDHMVRELCVGPGGGVATLKLVVHLDEKIKLTDGAPQKWSIVVPDNSWSAEPSGGNFSKETEIQLKVPPAKVHTSNILRVSFKLFVCREETVCTVKQFLFLVRVLHLDSQQPNRSLTLSHTISF